MRARRWVLVTMLTACGQRPLPVATTVPAATPGFVAIDVADASSPATFAPAGDESSDILGYRSYRLVPGLAAEVDFDMKAGATVTAEFRASGALVMDSHHHVGKTETVIYGTGRGHSGRLRFTAPFAGVFSFLWAPAGGPTEPVDVYLLLRGDATVIKWMVGAPTSATGTLDPSQPKTDLDH